ncbi:MAG: CehA/McbA family metallohydrolase [Vicinamibacterales bacterium]
MARRLALVLIALALLAVAAVVAGRRLAPPPAEAVAAASWPPGRAEVRGAYHVHSRLSDGTGTRAEIAAAAARAGLDFVILTDHGNALRRADPPAYLDGVLVADGVEISTSGGHYVALGLDRPAPYPLAGAPRAVVEDVRRLGGFGIAAHPDSAKAALAWRGWDLPFDGLEWLNADSAWRDELLAGLGRILLTYPVRPVETLASILDRPVAELDRWDRLTATRRVPALAGADAHARLGYREGQDPYEDRVLARVPPYDVSFRAFSNHVLLERPWTGDAAEDWALLLDGIERGRVYTSIDGRAAPGRLDFVARSGAGAAWMGDYLAPAGPVTLDARVQAPPGTTLVLLRDGAPVYDTRENELRIDVGSEPAAYRMEARLPGDTGAPWLLSNPIYVGLEPRHLAAAADASAPPPAATTRTPVATSAWVAEASDGSSSSLGPGRLDDGTPALEWRYALGGDRATAPYAAMLFPVDGALPGHDRLRIRARASRPMRAWVQVRARDAAGGRRWGASFYLDGELSEQDVFFAGLAPLDGQADASPDLAAIDALLIVVDTVNTLPGTAGTIQIGELWLEGGR